MRAKARGEGVGKGKRVYPKIFGNLKRNDHRMAFCLTTRVVAGKAGGVSVGTAVGGSTTDVSAVPTKAY